MYEYTYYGTMDGGYAALGGILFSVIAITLIVELAAIVLACVGMWRTFKKLGIQPWAALIPFYNDWRVGTAVVPKDMRPLVVARLILFAVVLLGDALGLPGTLITICGLAYGLVWLPVMHELALRFGHGWGYAVGLSYLGFVFWMLLGRNSEKLLPPTIEKAEEQES